jgi:hypothetical protein
LAGGLVVGATPNSVSGQAQLGINDRSAPRASGDGRFTWRDLKGYNWFDGAKSLLAVVGIVAVSLRLVRVIR